MSRDDLGDVTGLMDLMDDVLKVQKKMGQSLPNQRGHIIAVQLAVLAIAEQLAEAGLLDPAKAGQRMFDLIKTIEPDRMQEQVKPYAALFAARLDQMSTKPRNPTPPGTGLRLVVDND